MRYFKARCLQGTGFWDDQILNETYIRDFLIEDIEDPKDQKTAETMPIKELAEMFQIELTEMHGGQYALKAVDAISDYLCTEWDGANVFEAIDKLGKSVPEMVKALKEAEKLRGLIEKWANSPQDKSYDTMDEIASYQDETIFLKALGLAQ